MRLERVKNRTETCCGETSGIKVKKCKLRSSAAGSNILIKVRKYTACHFRRKVNDLIFFNLRFGN
jgi:hypothetical protein